MSGLTRWRSRRAARTHQRG